MSACGKWLVVFGGLRNRACLNDAAALDTERMVWQPLEVEGARPPARGNHAAVVLSTAGAHRLWVFGGDAPASGFAPPEAWALQLQLDGGAACSWSCPATSGPPPPACCDHAAAACGTSVLLLGGSSSGGYLPMGELPVLDTRALVWGRLRCPGTPPAARAPYPNPNPNPNP